jgi:hypothetical protein
MGHLSLYNSSHNFGSEQALQIADDQHTYHRNDWLP